MPIWYGMMDADSIHIAVAGNVEVPCYLALRDLGFALSRNWTGGESEEEMWEAERDGVRLVAGGPLELLGLAKLAEMRRQAWQAPDAETDAFLNRFYPGGSTDQSP